MRPRPGKAGTSYSLPQLHTLDHLLYPRHYYDHPPPPSHIIGVFASKPEFGQLPEDRKMAAKQFAEVRGVGSGEKAERGRKVAILLTVAHQSWSHLLFLSLSHRNSSVRSW